MVVDDHDGAIAQVNCFCCRCAFLLELLLYLYELSRWLLLGIAQAVQQSMQQSLGLAAAGGAGSQAALITVSGGTLSYQDLINQLSAMTTTHSPAPPIAAAVAAPAAASAITGAPANAVVPPAATLQGLQRITAVPAMAAAGPAAAAASCSSAPATGPCSGLGVLGTKSISIPICSVPLGGLNAVIGGLNALNALNAAGDSSCSGLNGLGTLAAAATAAGLNGLGGLQGLTRPLEVAGGLTSGLGDFAVAVPSSLAGLSGMGVGGGAVGLPAFGPAAIGLVSQSNPLSKLIQQASSAACGAAAATCTTATTVRYSQQQQQPSGALATAATSSQPPGRNMPPSPQQPLTSGQAAVFAFAAAASQLGPSGATGASHAARLVRMPTPASVS